MSRGTIALRPARTTRVLTAAWLLLLASSAFYFLSTNEADNDLWGHVYFGRAIVQAGDVIRHDPYTYTAPNAPWMNHEWLSQVLLYAAYARAGGPGLWVLKFAVTLATAALLFARVRAVAIRNAASPWVWGPVGLLALAVLSRGGAIRPQMFSYLGFAAVLAWCDREHARGGWWLPLAFVVWVNLHGGFVLGLGVLALYAIVAITTGPTSQRGRTLVLLMLSLAATLVNPYGWRLLTYIAGELTVEHPITEWQAAAVGDVSQQTFFALLALYIVTLPFARWREQSWQTVLAIATAAMALQHQRHTPVFAIAAAAPTAAQMAAAVRWWPWRRFVFSAGAQRLLGGALIALALAQVTLQGRRLVADRFAVVFDPNDYPVDAVRALAADTGDLNLAVPLDWGEYVLWHVAPRVKVSLDGRFATLFPPAVVRDNFNFFAGEGEWTRLLTAYPTEAALVPRAAPCLIRQQPGWQRVYVDSIAEIYVRSDRVASVHLGATLPQPTSGIFP
ncbi:MAG: hypothetical protein HYR72_20440 [Deltaproteobacteria bacterium]|nr:hypothetical protein [Deltaproteobacteria bacterium]MBI3389377.1 hypothetical protein [Deltaproteobacteria bacterium]